MKTRQEEEFQLMQDSCSVSENSEVFSRESRVPKSFTVVTAALNQWLLGFCIANPKNKIHGLQRVSFRENFTVDSKLETKKERECGAPT